MNLLTLQDVRERKDEMLVVKLGKVLTDSWRKRCTEENRNLLIAIVGDTGSGKSWASLRLGYDLDKRLNMNRVVFTPVELLRLVRSNLRPGSAIVLDEAQIPADHRKWFTATVDTIRYITQTARFKNNILIFTTPDMSLLDTDARKLFHYIIDMKDIDYKHNRSRGEIVEIVRYSHAGNMKGGMKQITFGRYRPRVMYDGRYYSIDSLWFAKPPKKLVEPYEAKKKEYMNKFYEHLESQLVSLTQTELNLNQIAEIVYNKLEEYRGRQKGRLAIHKIMLDFGISQNKAKQVEVIVSRKATRDRMDEEKVRELDEEIKEFEIKKKKKRIALQEI